MAHAGQWKYHYLPQCNTNNTIGNLQRSHSLSHSQCSISQITLLLFDTQKIMFKQCPIKRFICRRLPRFLKLQERKTHTMQNFLHLCAWCLVPLGPTTKKGRIRERIELLFHSPLSGARLGFMAPTAKLSKLAMGDCYVLLLWLTTMHAIVRAEAEQRDLRVNADELHHCRGLARSIVMHWHSLYLINTQCISNLRHEILYLMPGWAFVLIR